MTTELSSTETEPADPGPSGVPDGTPEGVPESATSPEPGNAEAAKYRRQLRAAEQARDGLTERVTALQRREVERLAAGKLAQAGDLFTIGAAELGDLLDDDGDVDAAKVATAVGALLDSRPGLAPARPLADFGQGVRDGSASASWADVVRGRG